ncbi:MAG TPA: DinB family protein [Acidimicrobiales bacterium]|jgi:uncharacterized damage-inducible protein DinB|nr:DinB family protein [Acidimicrobiales bacterium]
MADKEFPEPGFEPTDERQSLGQWLDYHRGVLVWKLDGLSDDDARRSMVPSGTSLLGLVKHLTDVERWWFQEVFAGRDLPELEGDQFQPRLDESVAELVAAYREACAESRRVAAGAGSLDEVARHRQRKPTLRWVMVHMIEETARHNGHADILRELLDGTIGD